jgi:diguanylate cyclase (GGDEF)-like protein/PAS domain S-box-containing protein
MTGSKEIPSPESTESLLRQLKLLEEDNRQLRARCQQLQSTQEALEQVIGDSNAKQLRAEMSSMELEQVFSACTDALWVIREDGIVVRANQAMLDLLDKPMAEVIGQKCKKFLAYHRCDSTECPLFAGRKSKCEFDIQLDNAAGEPCDYILTTAPLITLDGSNGIVVQFKNITCRKKAEKELELANISLERMARVDGLTQIANRRCLDETLAKEWQRLSRTGEPLALLLGDIDFFKKFNDHYGHQAGDDCLRQVGKALADAMLRPADLAARYGGEEFAILLPGTDLEGARQVGERILAAIRRLGIKHQKSEVKEVVTISLGAACLIPSAAQTPADLVACADQALYLAKAAGRNRISLAEAETDRQAAGTGV